jgi:hypothetical protein
VSWISESQVGKRIYQDRKIRESEDLFGYHGKGKKMAGS